MFMDVNHEILHCTKILGQKNQARRFFGKILMCMHVNIITVHAYEMSMHEIFMPRFFLLETFCKGGETCVPCAS